jgi:hypothetical protein
VQRSRPAAPARQFNRCFHRKGSSIVCSGHTSWKVARRRRPSEVSNHRRFSRNFAPSGSFDVKSAELLFESRFETTSFGAVSEGPAVTNRSRSRNCWIEADCHLDNILEALFIVKVLFHCFDRNMSQEKLTPHFAPLMNVGIAVQQRFRRVSTSHLALFSPYCIGTVQR